MFWTEFWKEIYSCYFANLISFPVPWYCTDCDTVFFFVAQGKAWNKKTILVIMATIAVVTFIGSFTNLLDSVLADTQYTNVVSDWQSWQDNGTNIFRVLVYAVPAILSFIGKRYLDEANNPCINFLHEYVYYIDSNLCCVDVYIWYLYRKTSYLFFPI